MTLRQVRRGYESEVGRSRMPCWSTVQLFTKLKEGNETAVLLTTTPAALLIPVVY